jgi:hypothetical protein
MIEKRFILIGFFVICAAFMAISTQYDNQQAQLEVEEKDDSVDEAYATVVREDQVPEDFAAKAIQIGENYVENDEVAIIVYPNADYAEGFNVSYVYFDGINVEKPVFTLNENDKMLVQMGDEILSYETQGVFVKYMTPFEVHEGNENETFLNQIDDNFYNYIDITQID